ncbi:MAG: CRTAC1 family protein [Planctomycetota bacterium]
MSAFASPQGFVERSAELGLDHEFVSGGDRVALLDLYDMLQQGLSLGDLDGDGDLDVVACGGLGRNTVLRNDGGTFVDISSQARIEVGEYDRVAPLGDFDGDGDLDVFVGQLEGGDGPAPGGGRLYINDGSGIFDEVTHIAGTIGDGHSIFAQWHDLDMDGLLDLNICEFHGTPNVWYRNNGDGSFSERAVAQGVAHEGSTHVSAIADFDQDGYLDLMVGNDHTISKVGKLLTQDVDGIYYGQADHTLLDLSDDSGADQLGGIMGITLGDVNYDGLMDAYKTDVSDNWLLVNQGWPGTGVAWTEEQDAYGVTNATFDCQSCAGGLGKAVGWTAVFFHADLDPWIDLFLANGQVAGLNPANPFSPRNQPNFLYHGDGPSTGFLFTDMSTEFGFTETIDDRAGAIGDIDQDGDVDLFVGPTTGQLRYYENQVPRDGNDSVTVTAVTNTSAPGGVGTEVSWTDSLGYPHVYVVGGDAPTASQSDRSLVLGIGAEPSIDLTVKFPSGLVRTFPGVPAGAAITVLEPELVRISAYTLPIDQAAGDGDLTGGGGLSPAGLFWVTAFAAGELSGETATIEVAGLTPLTPVLPIGADEFRRYYAAPSTPGTHRVSVGFDSLQLRVAPQVHFFDPADVSGTVITTYPQAVRAGSNDVVEVVIAPKTADGILVGRGKVVDFDIPGFTVLQDVVDREDGSYAVLLQAPADAGSYSFDVLVDGVPAGGGSIEAGGIANPVSSDLEREGPVPAQSAAPYRFKLHLTPRDDAGNRLGPRAVVTLEVLEDPGSEPVLQRTDLWPLGQRDGQFLFVLEKPKSAPEDSATGFLRFTIDGTLFPDIPYSF